MAVDGYMSFMDYSGNYMLSESQITAPPNAGRDINWKTFHFDTALTGGKADAGAKGGSGGAGKAGLFEIEDFSFDIEQTLNIGSQSSGAGAGKVTFNPFSITRKIDRFSPRLFEMACSGTPFKFVTLGLRKSAGGDQSGVIFLVFLFKLVACKTISWSYDDESPKETVTFEYGGLQVHYSQQNPDGSLASPVPGGWNRVRNVKDQEVDKEI